MPVGLIPLRGEKKVEISLQGFSGMRQRSIPRRFFAEVGIETVLAFCHEPDEAGRSIFTVDIRIFASEAFLAEISLVFQADVLCFTFGMIDTESHNALPLMRPIFYLDSNRCLRFSNICPQA